MGFFSSIGLTIGSKPSDTGKGDEKENKEIEAYLKEIKKELDRQYPSETPTSTNHVSLEEAHEKQLSPEEIVKLMKKKK